MFPLFTARFFNQGEDAQTAPRTSTPKGGAAAQSNVAEARAPGAACKIASLKALDLQTLSRDDGPPTELRTRKEKIDFFDRQCSHVGDRLYVSGETVAKRKDIMHRSGITHIVNCVGFLYPAYFKDEFTYQTLYLQDSPGEDILSVLYDVFDFIESSPEGRVLIHCSQGVSRSTTLAIAYRMYREQRSYDDVFADVKSKRGVANPNIGFICQLLQWQKRRGSDAEAPRLYRVAPQSPSAPQYLVPKLANAATPAALDPRGAFVLHVPSAVYIWSGAQCPEAFVAAARRAADQLHRYEGAPSPLVEVDQGREPREFWEALGCSEAQPLHQVGSYDRDYELYVRAAAPGTARGSNDSWDSARSGRKTPRASAGVAATSPNDRLRKQARSEALERERERGARAEPSNRAAERGLPAGTGTGRSGQPQGEEGSARRRASSPAVLQRAGFTPRRGEEAVAGSSQPAAPRAGLPPAVPKLSLAPLQPQPQAEAKGDVTAPGRRPLAVPRLNLRG